MKSRTSRHSLHGLRDSELWPGQGYYRPSRGVCRAPPGLRGDKGQRVSAGHEVPPLPGTAER